MQVLLVTAILLGLGGSLHCLGMCGPLVLSIHHGTSDGGVWSGLLYHISRAFIYGLMGLVFGLVGQGLYWMDIQQYLSILAGVVLLIVVLWPKLNFRWIPSFLQNFVQKSFHKLQSLPVLLRIPALGMLNALLPCGLVYTALGVSLVTARTSIEGFIFMFVFGLGTLPALWILGIVRGRLKWSKWKNAHLAVRSLTLVVAALLILRGLDLGIPYVSPAQNPATQTMGECCSSK